MIYLPGERPTSDGAAVTVHLARHGQTLLNQLQRVQGWCDSPLTARGRGQSAELGRRLRRMGPPLGAVRTADMVRHHETATIALAEGGFAVVPERDERLREASFGPFEGAREDTLWGAFAAHLGYPDARTMFDGMGIVEYLDVFDQLGEVAGATDFVVETSAQVADRALAALTDVVDEQRTLGGGHVLVVSSGLTIVCVLRALGYDLAQLSGAIDNGASSALHHDGEAWSILAVNDPNWVP